MTDDLNFVQKARREKLDALIANGTPPFAYRFDRTHQAADALALYPEGGESDGETVRLAGRLLSWRSAGKTAFAHLADSSGRIQLYFKRDVLGDDVFGLTKHFDLGDVIGIEGPLFRTRTGEVTVRVSIRSIASGDRRVRTLSGRP